MWPYILLVAIPCLTARMELRPGMTLQIGRQSNQAMKVFWGLLVVLLVLRHDRVGIDLKTYKHIFMYIAQSDWNRAIGRSPEIGSNLLLKLLSCITDDFRWVMVVAGLLGTCFVARAYVRYTEDALLSIALFVIMPNFVLLFSGLRQAIAISIGFVAFEFVRKKKVLAFLAVVTLAMTIHISAFMLLMLYPLYYLRIRKRSMLWVVPSLGVLLAFNQQIFVILTGVLNRFTKYDGRVSSTGAYTMLILFACFAVFAYAIPEESQLDADTMGMRNYLMFAVVLQMFAPLHDLAMRMNYYYVVFIPLLMPRIIKRCSIRWKQVAVVSRYVMVVFFLGYYVATVPKNNALQTYPYWFFWEKA